MKALILAGGLGTRLREETEFRPKPMVEVGGRPILWHIMKHLSCYGISEFVVAVGYKGELVKDYFLNYAARNNDFTVRLGARDSIEIHGAHNESSWLVTVTDTGPGSLTGARVRRASQYLGGDRFLVAYGDGVSNVNVDNLLEVHKVHGTLATVTVAHPPSRFGVVEIDRHGKASSFREKPKLDEWVNIGYLVLEPAALSFIDDGPLETGAIHRLAEAQQLGVYQHADYWQPMDTIREVELLNEIWASGHAPWASWMK